METRYYSYLCEISDDWNLALSSYLDPEEAINRNYPVEPPEDVLMLAPMYGDTAESVRANTNKQKANGDAIQVIRLPGGENAVGIHYDQASETYDISYVYNGWKMMMLDYPESELHPVHAAPLTEMSVQILFVSPDGEQEEQIFDLKTEEFSAEQS